jgi:hypothetical protein
MIPRNVRLAEAPSFGKPALFHDKESRGALAYLALAGEMIRRDELPVRARIIRPYRFRSWDLSCPAKSRLWVVASLKLSPLLASAPARPDRSRPHTR